MLAVGIFAKEDRLENLSRYSGILHGGGFYLLGVQTLACLALSVWASLVTFLLIKVMLFFSELVFKVFLVVLSFLCNHFFTKCLLMNFLKCFYLVNCVNFYRRFFSSIFRQFINMVRPFRMTEIEELIGADYMEHNIHHPGVGVTRAVSVIGKRNPSVDLGLTRVGNNKGHSDYLEKVYAAKLANVEEDRKRRWRKRNAVGDADRY